jgi:hypothetical protein
MHWARYCTSLTTVLSGTREHSRLPLLPLEGPYIGAESKWSIQGAQVPIQVNFKLLPMLNLRKSPSSAGTTHIAPSDTQSSHMTSPTSVPRITQKELLPPTQVPQRFWRPNHLCVIQRPSKEWGLVVYIVLQPLEVHLTLLGWPAFN